MYSVIEDHPEFVPRDKHSIWIYKLTEDCRFESPFLGYDFSAEWLRIEPDGTIIIPKGYAWNGCSPKFSFFDLFLLGTPDGINDVETGRPKAYLATLVHDALYQYYSWHELPREAIDLLFLEMLKESRFRLAKVYYFALRLFGGFFVARKHPRRAVVSLAAA